MTYIGKRINSIISTYIAPNGREIRNIKFYNKDTQEVIANTNERGWLTETNPYGSDMRVDGFCIKGEVKSYNANVDIKKKMSLGENFTVNVQKKYNFDEPQCELYVVIDNKNAKLLKDERQQELMTTVYDNISTNTYFYRVVEIEVEEAMKGKRISVSFKNNIGNRQEDTTKENAELDKVYEVIKELGIYVDKSDVGKILNKFNLVQRDETLQDQITKRVQETYPNEKYDKIINY